MNGTDNIKTPAIRTVRIDASAIVDAYRRILQYAVSHDGVRVSTILDGQIGGTEIIARPKIAGFALDDLTSQGFLTRTGSGQGCVYRITEAGRNTDGVVA